MNPTGRRQRTMSSRQKSLTFARWATITLRTGCLVGCGGGDGPTTGGLPANTGEAMKTYAAIVRASYEDAAGRAHDLDTAVQALVAGPSVSTLSDARTAWLE